jgi:hypothetical protein
MIARTKYFTLLALAICVTLNGQAQAQYEGPTLWKFLGIPQSYRRVRDGVSNRRGNRPGMERRPPVKRLADPANLDSDVEAIKAAAEIKQAEDLKLQKIKAIKYLAEIGCGCYDKDGKVSDALAAALDDCTEDVRMATVEAIMEAANGECCSQCGSKSCCKEKVVLQLARLAYERDDKGCWVEPSERVRQAAAQALAACCPSQAPLEVIATEPEQIETPEAPESPEDIEMPEAPEAPAEAAQAHRPSMLPPPPMRSISAQRSPELSFQPGPPVAIVGDRQTPEADYRTDPSTAVVADSNIPSIPEVTFQPDPPMSFVVTDRDKTRASDAAAPATASKETVHGGVVWVDTRAGIAHVHFANDDHQLRPGTTMRVYRRMLNGDLRPVGRLAVVKVTPGGANVQAAGGTSLSQYRRGDTVMVVTENRPDDRTAQTTTARPDKAPLTLVEWLQQ